MAKVVSIAQGRKVSGNLRRPPHAACEEAGSRRNALIEFCTSLAEAKKQKQFRAFPEGYCREFGLSMEQIHAVTDLDIVRLLDLGLTLAGLDRLASVCNVDAEELCQEQTGKTLEAIFRQHA